MKLKKSAMSENIFNLPDMKIVLPYESVFQGGAFMPRPLRLCVPGYTYHVFSRCIESRDLLEDHFKDVMMMIMKRTQEVYDFELIHFAILDNHFHFIIRTVEDGATISRIMQYIKARFAETYNRLMGRTGPFWNERFGDVIVERQLSPARYLLWLMWYIAYNPVRKGYVRDPEKYKYSSINCYIKRKVFLPVRITLHRLFLELDDNIEFRIRKFRDWEDAYRKRYAIPFEG